MSTIELQLEEKVDYFTREAFNTLRTNVLFSGRDVKVILITSCMAHEGKSTISFELSKSLAECGKKVLFIDADLRKSVFAARYSKTKGLSGLSQYLSGQVTLDDVLFSTQIPNFDIIFSGPFPPNPAELIGNTIFADLLKTQKEVYDYVIIDAPPLGMVIDASVMSSFCDGAIFVINSGTVKYRMAQHVADQIRRSGCRLLGVVLNDIGRNGKNKSGKYYKGYYHYAYGDGKYESATDKK